MDTADRSDASGRWAKSEAGWPNCRLDGIGRIEYDIRLDGGAGNREGEGKGKGKNGKGKNGKGKGKNGKGKGKGKGSKGKGKGRSGHSLRKTTATGEQLGTMARRNKRKAARLEKKQRTQQHQQARSTHRQQNADLLNENEALKLELAQLKRKAGQGTSNGDDEELAEERADKKKKKKKKKTTKPSGMAVVEPAVPTRDAFIEREDMEIRRLDRLLGKRKKRKKKRGAAAEEDFTGFDSDTSDEFLSELLGDISAYKEFTHKQVGDEVAQRRSPGKATTSKSEEDSAEEDESAEDDVDSEDEGARERSDDDESITEPSSSDDDDENDRQPGRAEEDDDDEEHDDDDDGDDYDKSSDDNDSQQDSISAGSAEDAQKEDIYGGGGFNMDKSASDASAPSKYVPPALRTKSGENEDPHSRLRGRVRGLVNRLSDENKDAVMTDLVAVFRENPRKIVSEIISSIVLDAVRGSKNIGGVSTEYLSLYAGLMCAVHVQTDPSTGAFFLEQLALAFMTSHEAGVDLKTPVASQQNQNAATNLVQMLVFFYLFNLVTPKLLYDLIRLLCKNMSELDVELLLLVLRNAGFKIRSDDPSSLKAIIVEISERAATVRSSVQGPTQSPSKILTRMNFMLETITNLKNNKQKLGSKSADEQRCDRLSQWVASWANKLGGIGADYVLPVRWKQLIAVKKRGIWWLEPSRLNDLVDDSDEASGDESGTGLLEQENDDSDEDVDLLHLARKQRMNTDVRKAVFCALMGAEDYSDAFEKLMSLRLKPPRDREMVRVVIECCTKESQFNPYYGYVLKALVDHGKDHAYTVRYCMWDLVKEATTMPTRKLAHAGRLLAFLMLEGAVGWEAVKAVEWAGMPLSQQAFVQIFISFVLSGDDEEKLAEALKPLRERNDLAETKTGLLLFLKQLRDQAKSGDVALPRTVQKKLPILQKALQR